MIILFLQPFLILLLMQYLLSLIMIAIPPTCPSDILRLGISSLWMDISYDFRNYVRKCCSKNKQYN